MESNGRSKGCGLVEYSTEGEARYAIRSLHDTEIDGRKIFVREDREAPTASTSTNTTKTTGCRVYVGNLSWTVKWQDLKDHMKQAGNVVYCDGAKLMTFQNELIDSLYLQYLKNLQDDQKDVDQLSTRHLNKQSKQLLSYTILNLMDE